MRGLQQGMRVAGFRVLQAWFGKIKHERLVLFSVSAVLRTANSRLLAHVSIQRSHRCAGICDHSWYRAARRLVSKQMLSNAGGWWVSNEGKRVSNKASFNSSVLFAVIGV